MPAFIETQFPIARLSAEAYKERKANNGQTLTWLGKWWGRKPLILVRAAILGMLMPASDDPKKDREIFLKILTMDDDGAWHRCKGDIPATAWREAAPQEIQEAYFTARGFQRGLTEEEKEDICNRIWESLDTEQRRALDSQRRRPVPERETFDILPYAVRGNGEDFRRAMVEIYQNLARHMPDNGLQMVMFTHQNPAVWADLGMILWAAGLKATAAWTISTETEAVGIKKGNYVQGTVCLVLRKRIGHEPGFLDEIFPMVEDEVRWQIDAMQALDEDGEPNFNDADYQLAAYAAALKVLTQYGRIDGRDVEHEVFAVRGASDKSDFQSVIERAIGIACDCLVPKGLAEQWRELNLAERYYLRALDIESRGERRKGMYEELARGFGVTDVRPLLKSDQANGARMHTASGFGTAHLAPIGGIADTVGNALPRRGRVASAAPHPFAASPLRHLLSGRLRNDHG